MYISFYSLSVHKPLTEIEVALFEKILFLL